MASDILNFVTVYKEKYERDPEKRFPIVTFSLSCTKVLSPMTYVGLHYPINLIELDEQDMQYLFEKYSKKLEEEMNTKIEQIKQDYKISANE